MFRQSLWLPIGICLALLALVVPASAAAQGICRASMGGDIANVHYEPDAIYWEPLVEYDQLILRVSTPCDSIEKVFERGEAPFFELREVLGSVDGDYGWELRVVPAVDPAVREVMTEAHETGDYSMVRKLQDQGLLPAVQSVEGSGFTVVEGRIIPPDQIVEKSPIAQRSSASPTGGGGNPLVTKDVLHYDDVIVTGSLCVGFDCVNGESFGYDTVKLKENNLRLYFEDTSVGSFPSGDWRIRINDTTSGGASYFAIEDATNGRTPFRIETGAPNHALYVEDYGRVGLGTSVPYVELHIVDGDTPTVRLDQDGSSGWATQVWDMAGNETNFFIRDVTNGSKMPVRIQPNAPSNSFSIRSDGDVGFGTWSPSAALHVQRSDAATTSFKVENTNATAQVVTMTLDNTASGLGSWEFRVAANGNLLINDTDATGQVMRFVAATGEVAVPNDLTVDGDLTLGGTCSGCDLVFQPEYDLESIDEHADLMWQHRHLPGVGPTPEGETSINVFKKTTGILQELEKAHIYIEQLNDRIKEKDTEISELRHELESLERTVGKLVAKE